MKKTVYISFFAVLSLFFFGCNDDDSDLSGVERSLVGCWQVVERHYNSRQEPIEGIQVMVFKPDRTQSFYKDGQLQYETQFWTKPVKDYDGYYLYHQPDEDYSQSTFSCTLEVSGNQLTICESGCFSVSKTVYKRIPSLNEATPVGYKYEDNPTMLEGTWHLTKIVGDGFQEYQILAGEVTVYFDGNHTIQVVNKEDTKVMKPFMNSGSYSYEIIKTETNKNDNTVYTTINLDGKLCTYWFKDGMMVIDYGMAYDAPAYFFKKLDFTNS